MGSEKAYAGHSEGALGRLVAEMDVYKLHQSREMKQRKLWEDEWQRWIARGGAERKTRTPREKRE